MCSPNAAFPLLIHLNVMSSTGYIVQKNNKTIYLSSVFNFPCIFPYTLSNITHKMSINQHFNTFDTNFVLRVFIKFFFDHSYTNLYAYDVI